MSEGHPEAVAHVPSAPKGVAPQDDPPAALLIVFTLWLLVFSSASQTMIIAPILPTIGVELDIADAVLGTLVSVYSLMVGVFAILAGPVSDKVGRRRILLMGCGAMAVALVLHAFVIDYYSFLFVRVLAGSAGGILSGAAVPYIGDAFPYRRRGWATGWVMSGSAFGQIIGIPLGIFMAARWGFRSPFYLFAATMAVTVLLLFFGVAQPDVKRTEHPLGIRKAASDYLSMLRRAEVAWAAAAFFLMFLGVSVFVVYLPTWLERDMGFTMDEIAGMFLVGGIANVVTGPQAGKLSDRIGRKGIILMACIGLSGRHGAHGASGVQPALGLRAFLLRHGPDRDAYQPFLGVAYGAGPRRATRLAHELDGGFGADGLRDRRRRRGPALLQRGLFLQRGAGSPLRARYGRGGLALHSRASSLTRRPLSRPKAAPIFHLPPHAPPGASLSTNGPQDVTVLYVEDAVDQALLVKTFLSTLPGFSVTHAQDGAKAVQLIAEASWDMLVTDLNLPDVDGFSVIKSFRAKYPEGPILVTTGYTQAEYEEHALRSGADQVMIKPLNQDEFLARVRSMAETAQEPEVDEPAAVVAIEGRLGDVEMGCGGTLRTELAAGHKVVVVPICRAATDATPEELKAAGLAAHTLGIELRVDRILFGNAAAQRDLIERTLNELRPATVYMPSPDDRDPSRKEAAMTARDITIEVESVLAYQTATTGLQFAPSIFNDVRAEMVLKMEALAAYQAVGAPRVDLRPRMAQAYARYWGRFRNFTEVEAFELIRGSAH